MRGRGLITWRGDMNEEPEVPADGWAVCVWAGGDVRVVSLYSDARVLEMLERAAAHLRDSLHPQMYKCKAEGHKWELRDKSVFGRWFSDSRCARCGEVKAYGN